MSRSADGARPSSSYAACGTTRCHDAAAFIGGVGYSELAAHPEALDQLRQDLRIDGRHDAAQLEQCLTHLGEGATAMLFRCTVCDTCLTYADASLRPLSSAAREIELIIPSEETAPNALSLREKLRVCC